MAHYPRSSATNPCPICGRTKDADCSRPPNNDDLAFCMKTELAPPGWKCFGKDKNGVFNVFAREGSTIGRQGLGHHRRVDSDGEKRFDPKKQKEPKSPKATAAFNQINAHAGPVSMELALHFSRQCNLPVDVFFDPRFRQIAAEHKLTWNLVEGGYEDAIVYMERDKKGNESSLRVRLRSGMKIAHNGSGVLAPRDVPPGVKYVIIPEGMTDYLTIQVLGRPDVLALARPNNTGGADAIEKWWFEHGHKLDKDVLPLVTSENDWRIEPDGREMWPGMSGAKSVAQSLANKLGRPFGVVSPPGPRDGSECKDIGEIYRRDWLMMVADKLGTSDEQNLAGEPPLNDFEWWVPDPAWNLGQRMLDSLLPSLVMFYPQEKLTAEQVAENYERLEAVERRPGRHPFDNVAEMLDSQGPRAAEPDRVEPLVDNLHDKLGQMIGREGDELAEAARLDSQREAKRKHYSKCPRKFRTALHRGHEGMYCGFGCGKWSCKACSPYKRLMHGQHIERTLAEFSAAHPGSKVEVTLLTAAKFDSMFYGHLHRKHGSYFAVQDGNWLDQVVVVSTISHPDLPSTEMDPLDAARMLRQKLDFVSEVGERKKVVTAGGEWDTAKEPEPKETEWKQVGEKVPGDLDKVADVLEKHGVSYERFTKSSGLKRFDGLKFSLLNHPHLTHKQIYDEVNGNEPLDVTVTKKDGKFIIDLSRIHRMEQLHC